MQHGQYRLRILTDLIRAVGFPCLSLAAVLRLMDLRLGGLTFPSYILSVFAWGWGVSAYTSWKQEREMRMLGARPIPRVKGKWPGNIDILLRLLRKSKTSYTLEPYAELFREYQCTTLNTRILWVDTIISMDQQHMKFVLATGFQHFWRGNRQKERMETFFGTGIFNRDDQVWKTHRNTAKPFFARERISDFETFEKFTSRTLSILSSQSASGQASEVQDLYARFTLDAGSEFLFGHNLNTLSNTLPQPGQPIGPRGSATSDEWGSFSKAFDMALQVITTRGRQGYFWPFFELKDQNSGHAEVVHKFLDPIVQRALDDKRREKETGVSNEIKEKTFLQHLADSTDDPVLIRDELLSFILASKDTNACLLTFVTYFMALYPEVAKRLRAEVLEHCGPNGTPTYEQIRNLKYMRAVLNETLRIYTPVPLNVRETRESAVVLPNADATFPSSDPRPLYMPAGKTITYLPFLVQRNEALWGEDVEVFDPDRWLDPERLGKFLANPTIFTPFSAGPRICVGQSYALNQASYFLIRLLQRFDTFSLASDVQPKESLPPQEWREQRGRQAYEKIWPVAAITLYIKGGMWIRMSSSS